MNKQDFQGILLGNSAKIQKGKDYTKTATTVDNSVMASKSEKNQIHLEKANSRIASGLQQELEGQSIHITQTPIIIKNKSKEISQVQKTYMTPNQNSKFHNSINQ